MERVLGLLARIGPALSASGAPMGAIYVEGASDAIQHAIDAVTRQLRSISSSIELMAGHHTVRLTPMGAGPYAAVEASRVAPPLRPAPTLGHSMLHAVEVRNRLRSDEVASALMAAALSHADWINIVTDEVFRGDPVAGRCVVGTVTGRDTFPSWSRRQMSGLIDRRSADLLQCIGWHRLTGPRLPGAD